MHIFNIMILAATALGVVFPIFLINAIRADDEDCASRSKIEASITFGALVFISLAIVNSN